MIEKHGIRMDHSGGVAHVMLVSPETGNSLNTDKLLWLGDMLEASETRSARSLLLTAEGRAFCVGGDLGRFDPGSPEADGYLRRLVSALNRVILALVKIEAPVVVAVQGVAAGAGFSLAIAGDILLCGDQGRFIAAYTRSALTPDGGLSFLLPRLTGYRRAFNILVRNPMIMAQEALACGICTEHVAGDGLQARARAVAEELSVGPTLAIAGVKSLMAGPNLKLFEAQLEAEKDQLCRLLTSDDLREGIVAFTQKRPPQFGGR